MQHVATGIQQEAQLPQTQPTMRLTAIQGHSRSSLIGPIDAAYMTSLLNSNLTSIFNR